MELKMGIGNEIQNWRTGKGDGPGNEIHRKQEWERLDGIEDGDWE